MFASARLKDDKSIVLAAVRNGCWSLIYASDRLKDDYDVVMAAVNKHGANLRYLSDRLKDDEAIVLAAVNQNGTVLQFASDRLRSDVNFCIECAKKDPDSITYFLGEAKELFKKYQKDIEAVQSFYTQQQQNKADEALLAKIKKTPHTIPSFKRNIVGE
jgi:hypothetical protein